MNQSPHARGSSTTHGDADGGVVLGGSPCDWSGGGEHGGGGGAGGTGGSGGTGASARIHRGAESAVVEMAVARQ